MGYKILSIDGGGIKGVFPASFLASVEESVGDKIGNYFDLIVGTSTGGIIALALGSGMSAKEVLKFYEEEGPIIFEGSRFLRFIRHFGISKYSNSNLKKSLESKFGEKILGESFSRLVVPSLNLETGEVYVYKTAHNPRFERDYRVKMVDVALATSAAPTYFPTHKSAVGLPMIDGGVWANNPMGLAVVEALGSLGWQKGSFEILSIGCTQEPLNIKAGRRLSLGWGYWGPRIVNAFMVSQSSFAYGMAQWLAGHEKVVRINPTVPNGRFGLDVVKEIDSLRGLGDSEARKALPSIRHFFEEKAEPFIPFHKI